MITQKLGRGNWVFMHMVFDIPTMEGTTKQTRQMSSDVTMTSTLIAMVVFFVHDTFPSSTLSHNNTAK